MSRQVWFNVMMTLGLIKKTFAYLAEITHGLMNHVTRPYGDRVGKLVLALFAMILIAPAMAFKPTGSLTGFWEQPDQQNHGLILAISRLPDGELTGVAFWAHYDNQSSPTWLLAQGPLVGDRMAADLYQVRGIGFMQPSGTAADPEERIGSFEVTFESCDRAEVFYDTSLASVGSGSFGIARLTTIPGADCSGGITDNVPPSALPESFEFDLQPADGFPRARGEVEWELRPGSAEFEIDIEYVAPGSYTVVIGGVERGTIAASIDDDDELAEGEIEFRSPQRRNYPLLDFDPRGQNVEIFLDEQLVLSGVIPEAGQAPGQPDAPDFGDLMIKVDMNNAGVYPGGDAELELEIEPRKVSFEVEVEDVPVGNYSLRVDTIERGIIHVTAEDDGDTEGELEFRFPATPGYPLLDFDPRGALIEIMQGESTLFFVDFPGAGGGGNPGQPGTGPSGPDLEIDYDIPNLGVFPEADAKAEFSRDDDGLEFEVEIEDVPAGSYTLRFGGVVRGSIIAVVDEDEGDDGDFSAEGEIEFSNPQRSGDELLDFDVGGELIEILDGETVIFRGTFPDF